jgi:hypothetical protein
LIGAQPQNILEVGCNVGPPSRNQRGELRVERAALSENARRQLVRQTAVGLRQPADLPSERDFERLSVSNLTQNSQGRPARLYTRRAGHHGGHHEMTVDRAPLCYSSIPARGLDGTATSRRGMRPAR